MTLSTYLFYFFAALSFLAALYLLIEGIGLLIR